MNWSDLTNGKFYSSGMIMIDPEDGCFKDARFIKAINPEYSACLYDTVALRNKKYQYKSDNEAYLYIKDSSLRIDLDKAVCFLKEAERNYLLNKFHEAYSKCQEFCSEDMFASFMILTVPPKRTPMHKHSGSTNTTFTYVTRNNISSVNSGLNIDIENKIEQIPFPNTGDFFFVFDTGLNHGTYRCEEDINSYIFFVFDGVELKNKDVEFLKMYEINSV